MNRTWDFPPKKNEFDEIGRINDTSSESNYSQLSHQTNEFTHVLSPKKLLFWPFEFWIKSENVEISLPVDFWRCFRSTFECNELGNFFRENKTRFRFCCVNEIRDLGLFAREALALFGMDEVKLLGDLSRVERGCQTLFEGSFKARATAKTEKEFDTHFKAIISRWGSSEARTESVPLEKIKVNILLNYLIFFWI